MSGEPQYRIRIPANGKKPEQWIDVDPLTLHLGVITELFRWDSQRQQHRSVKGVEHLVNTGLDPKELVEWWQDIVAQIDDNHKSATGTSRVFAQELHGALSQMPEFIQLLASGRIAAALKALEAIGYGLMQAGGTAVSKLAELEARADQHLQLAGGMVDIVIKQDERNAQQATELVDAIKEGFQAFDALNAFEADLVELFDLTAPKSAAWCAMSDPEPDSPWLREQLKWLSDQETGFCTRASRFRMEPVMNQVETMVALIAEARQRIQHVRDRVTSAMTERDEAREFAESILQQMEIEPHIKTMRSVRELVAKAVKHDIHTFAITTGLVTQDEFNRWQGLLTDQKWHSLHAAGIQLRELMDNIRLLVDQTPRLSNASQKKLEQAEHYVEKLEETLQQCGVEPVPLVIDPPTEDVAATTESPSDIDEGRLHDLYEQVVGVGAAKYCLGSGYLIGTQLRPILRILERLGRISAEEQALYGLRLQELMDEHSYNKEEDTSGHSRLQIWRELPQNQAQWLKFLQGRGKSQRKYWHWRLVEQAHGLGLWLCEKHGLDPEEVVAAHAALRVEQNKAHKKKRAEQ